MTNLENYITFLLKAILFFVLMGLQPISPQNSRIDSLENVIRRGFDNDTIKLNTIADLCWEYVIVDPAKIKPFF